MKVFVAGASGAIGIRLVPLLISRGHDVTAMTRSTERARALSELGASTVLADGLDRAAVRDAVLRAEPEVVIHQMTSLSSVVSFKDLDRALAPTNRLRLEGTDHLLEASREAGVRRFVAQSYGLWAFAVGDDPRRATESDPHLAPPPTMRQTLAAVRHVESTVPAADGLVGIVLRYGIFYGPGTSIAADGAMVDIVRARKWPVIGDGAGVWSFVHVDDAAAATLAAVTRGEAGIYNVADDEPAPIRTWLPELAKTVGAAEPRRVPKLVGRLAGGESAVYLATRINGLSNTKAQQELGWRPLYASWRDGFRHGLAAPSSTSAEAA